MLSLAINQNKDRSYGIKFPLNMARIGQYSAKKLIKEFVKTIPL